MTTPFEKIPGTDKIESTPRLGEETGKTPSQSFQSYMDQAGGQAKGGMLGGPEASKGPAMASPFDLAGGQPLATGPTMQSLLAQTMQAHASLGDISSALSTPNLKLKQSQKYLLKNKLTSAKAHLRSANSKLGTDPIPDDKEEGESASKNPFGKFLSLVTDGQNQLQAAQHQLKSMDNTGSNINPAELLLVQIKLNKAQQEIEYSSIILSNAVSDIKMLFGIQL